MEKQSQSSIVENENNETEVIEEEVPDYDITIKNFNDGDIIKGKIIKIDRDEVLLDVGYKSEGVIPPSELSIRKDANPEDVVTLGDEIEALVLQKEDSEGRLILSKKRAEQVRAWDKLFQIKSSDETIKGEVIEVVKGGLILDIGVRGFLPASLVDTKRVRDLQGYIGQELECKIIEVDRNRKNVVLSRKAVIESDKQGKLKDILSALKKGDVLEGTISSIVDFGAFVDLNGIDGLIHVSELSWERINHPSEIVSLGNKVKVKILDIDLDRERISLGLKQTQPDPWRDKVGKFSVGAKVKGKVVRLANFGAFVSFNDDLEGLVHISELSLEHIKSPEEAVRVGDEIEIKIIDIDYNKRRIGLSLKETLSPVLDEKTENIEEIDISDEEDIKDKSSEGQEIESEEFSEDKNTDLEEEVEEKTAVKAKSHNQLKSSSELNELSSETRSHKEAESLESILEDMKQKSGRKRKEPSRELKREDNQVIGSG